MCGRFSLTKEEAEIEKRFQAKFYSNDLIKRYNVAPSQLALVLTAEKPAELQFFKWGLIPSWSKDSSSAYKMINAKSETIYEKPSFKTLIEKKRCLVITDGFYEWLPLDKKNKQPYRIALKEEELFAFGGLYDTWLDKLTGELLQTFTIITTPANEMVNKVHDRMPLILNRDDEKNWLDLNCPTAFIKSLLNPYPFEKMKIYPVSKKVNSPANDCSDILTPLEQTL